MSHDPSSPSDRLDREPDGETCPLCRGPLGSPNVELFEAQGVVACDDCAEALLEEDED